MTYYLMCIVFAIIAVVSYKVITFIIKGAVAEVLYEFKDDMVKEFNLNQYIDNETKE